MAITISPQVYSELVPTDPAAERAALAAEKRHRPISELIEKAVSLAGASDHTKRAYREGIGLFLQYLEAVWDAELPPSAAAVRPFAEKRKEGRRTVWTYRPPAGILAKVTPADLLGFEAWLLERGDSRSTAEMRGYIARTFLAVAAADNVITPMHANELGIKPYRPKRKRHQKPVGRRLSKTEVQALRSTVNTDTLKGKRDLAILDMMLYLGLRSEEVASITTGDFVQDLGRWWLVVKGKGDRARKVKVHDAAFLSLSAWLDASGLGQVGESEAPVFVGVLKGGRLSNTPINTAVIRRLVAEYGHAAGIAPLHGKGRLSPHDLRRTAARNAFDNGASLLLVQKMLGHASPQTTAHYIGIEETPDKTAVDFVRY